MSGGDCGLVLAMQGICRWPTRLGTVDGTLHSTIRWVKQVVHIPVLGYPTCTVLPGSDASARGIGLGNAETLLHSEPTDPLYAQTLPVLLSII